MTFLKPLLPLHPGARTGSIQLEPPQPRYYLAVSAFVTIIARCLIGPFQSN
jgi:hypothetical protein